MQLIRGNSRQLRFIGSLGQVIFYPLKPLFLQEFLISAGNKGSLALHSLNEPLVL